MKILLVVNKTLDRGGIKVFDGGYFCLYVPFLQLGHQVKFFDIADKNNNNSTFLKDVDSFKPDLIFCCLTGNQQFMPGEPDIQLFGEITRKGNIKTFNWFCDDTWRFDNFSSKVCSNFTYCSTPEPIYLQKYIDIGYNNILLGGWHSNIDMYIQSDKSTNLAFCGMLNSQRRRLQQLLEKYIPGTVFKHGISYEDMNLLYSRSKIGLNFSINANNGKTQMKGRMFEIPASRAVLLTEYTEGLEEFYELEKEIITFKTDKEMFEKIIYFLKNDSERVKIAEAGFNKFAKEHDSKVRLKNILSRIC